MPPTAEENKEIDAEVKKKFKAAHINLSKVAPKDARINFISFAQLKSNNLLKVQRTVLFCIEYLVKISPKRMLTTKDDSPNCGGGENSVNYFWAMYNRKWYVVQKATDEETPDELRNKKVKEATVVKFLYDKTYSTIPNAKIQPFGNTEIDEKRGIGIQKAMQSPQQPNMVSMRIKTTHRKKTEKNTVRRNYQNY